MEQIPSSDANNHSTSQEISMLSLEPKVSLQFHQDMTRSRVADGNCLSGYVR